MRLKAFVVHILVETSTDNYCWQSRMMLRNFQSGSARLDSQEPVSSAGLSTAVMGAYVPRKVLTTH